MGIGAVTIGLAVVAVLVWLGILANSTRRRARRVPEEAPANLRPFLTDDELENRRLDKVLIAAVIVAAVLAIVMPIYYLQETDRQAEAAEAQAETDIHEGERWYGVFQCVNCHGVDGVGGGVAFVEPRSGLETTWAAPSLNDIFYRYDESEVRYWIVFGRAGSPMPAWGLEGGGAMTDQEVDQIIAYLRSLEIPQDEAFGQTETRVSQALDRIDRGAESVAEAITAQQEVLEVVEAAPATYQAVESLPEDFEALLVDDGTCTRQTAAIFEQPCRDPGVDSDRDGISDAAEIRLTDLLGDAAGILADRLALAALSPSDLAVPFDPGIAFSVTDAAGEPVPDLETLEDIEAELNTVMIGLSVTAEANDRFVATAESGLEFLQEAAAEEPWAIDFDELAATSFGGDVEAARRAAGLYNAYCARCHTGGYSAGVVFEQEPGAGGFGPSLQGGRSVVQFPDAADHEEFIIVGSENAKPYGINGLGRGWMPGFGFTLSAEDIRLIVEFERSL